MVKRQAMAELRSLIPTLIELGLKSATAHQEVQARQVIYGGDQQLNLFELGLVEESQVLSALSRVEGLPSAPAGPVPLDLELTAQLRAAGVQGVAGRRSDGTAAVSVTRHEDLGRKSAREALGEDCQIQVTTSLRMEEALAMFTGDELPPRVSAVLDMWGPRLRLTPASRPPSAAPRSPSEAETVTSALPPVEESQARDGRWGISTDLEPTHRPVEPLPAALSSKNPLLQAETAPPPVGYEDIAAFSATGAPRTRPPSTEEERNVYALEEAVEDLSAASNRDRIIEILVHFASSIFDYAAAFAIVTKEARGLRASGHGAKTAEVKELSIPLDLPSALQLAQSAKLGQVFKLRASGLEGGVARDLHRPVGIEVFLCPLILQKRPVVLLWCDNSGADIPKNARLAFERLMPHVATALTRVVLEKKKATRPPHAFDFASLSPKPILPTQHEAVTVLATPKPQSQAPVDSSSAPPPPPRAIIPDSLSSPPTQTKAPDPGPAPAHASTGHSSAPRAGSSSLPTSQSSPPTAARSRPERVSDIPSSSPTMTGLTKIVPHRLDSVEGDESAHTRRNPAAPPMQGPSPPRLESERPSSGETAHEIAIAKKRTLTRPGEPGSVSSDSDPPDSFPAEVPRTLKGYPEVKPPEIHPPKLAEIGEFTTRTSARPPLFSRRIVALGKNPQAQGSAIGSNPSSQPPPDAMERLTSTPEAPVPDEARLVTFTTGDTMMSRRPEDLESLLADSSRQSGLHPESTTDVAEAKRDEPKRPISFSDLVAELLRGNDSVLPQLLDGGETAVGALIAEFPGPVREPQSPSEKASECGPVLSALVRIGSKSLPFVTVRTADENPRVRRWATFLLGELPGKESASAIASRLLDSSIEVRRAALTSARRVRKDPLTRRSLRSKVEQMCRDQTMDSEERCSAVEALADIREHEAIPVLLQLLEDFSHNVARSARWALCVLTRQDFGDDVDAWRKFWQTHRDEDRVEWLITSLDHEQRDIRRAAGDELRALCGQDFGYDEDQASAERRKAQADFRTWWNETGKANLH